MCTILVIYIQERHETGKDIEKNHFNNEGNRELIKQEKSSACKPEGCDWRLYINQGKDKRERII